MTPLSQIIEAIADTENTKTSDLDVVLQNHVSVDAIQHLNDHESNAWRIQFETPNHVIELTGNDTIVVDGEKKEDVNSVTYR